MIPSTNIDSLHTAIKNALAAKFTTCAVALYPRPGEKITTPAILLELEDLPADDPDDIGSEQLAVVLNWNAYVVLDYKAGKKQAVKSLAAAVMAFVRGKRWGQSVGAANVVGAYPDVIAGREDDYEVMRIEWSHEALLGDDVWDADQLRDEEGEPIEPPTEVYSSDQPGIENTYTDLAGCGCDAE